MQCHPEQIKELLQEAFQARSRAHAPYSRFPVGAAILSADGYIYQGCNIENASFGLSICAERAALYHGWVRGSKEFNAIAIAYHPTHKALPCGSCRQVLAEFNPSMTIISANLQGEYDILSLQDLYPKAFLPSALQQ